MRAHKFRHDNEERRQWQNPEAILAEVGLGLGATFVDVGCGGGFFSIPAARIVGGSGAVYGLDSDGEALATLKQAAEKEGFSNLTVKRGEAESTVLCHRCADVVFFGVVLHEFNDRSKVLSNAKEMLKPGGRLAVLEWKKEPTPKGPPLDVRLSEGGAAELLNGAGFVIEEVIEAGPYHYLVKAKL